MIVGPPTPWHRVPIGATVLYGIPRTVQVNDPLPGDRRGVMLEGFPAFWPHATDTVHLVTLDDIDAIGHLLQAGLTIEPVKE